MSRSVTRVVLLAVLVALAPRTSSRINARQQPMAQTARQTIRIASEEVLLDVVARDKRGRPVNGLKAEEIEVYEDGVKQQIASFRKVDSNLLAAADAKPGTTGANNTPAAPAAVVDPLRQINLVTMIFERLNPAAGSSEKPKLTLEFLLDGEVIARANPELTLGAPSSATPNTIEHDALSYDAKCFACHQAKGERASSKAHARACKIGVKDCASCHMPKYEIPGSHFRFADHMIRVVKPNEPYPN